MNSQTTYCENDFLGQFAGERTKNPKHSCDVCGQRNWRYHRRNTESLGISSTKFAVYSCGQCGFLRMLPLPTKEELTAIYECYVEKGDRLAVERQRAQDVYPNKLKVVKSLVGGNRLLDVGAGLGTFVRVAMDAGFAAVGVEYSKEQCDVARRQYGINLLNDVIENWSIYFHPGSFDVVNMHHVFEHLLYPRSILPCVHEILASGGVLLIEVPNQFNRLRGNHSFYPRFSGYSGNPLHHQSFFSPKNLIRMVSSEGFSLITCRQFRENSEYDRGFVWNFSRKMYRYVVNKFSVGGGSFIECYFLKN